MKYLKFISRKWILVLCITFLASPLAAKSARDIMLKVDSVLKDSFHSTIQKVKLSTCKYRVNNKKMKCTSSPRVKVLEIVLKDYGKDKKDSRSVSVLLSPISEKGIGMLTYEYDNPNKDNDNWLYLPAIGKVKRLISSSEENEESGSFFGSEISIEDMEYRKIDDYTYKIIKEDTYNNRPVWIVESVPTAKRARKSKYSKTISWIDKERFILLKNDLYNRQGKLYKQLTNRNIEQIDGVWVNRRAIMINFSTRRVTNLELISVAYNKKILDEFLTQRTLTDFAFRERNLVKLRKHLK